MFFKIKNTFEFISTQNDTCAHVTKYTRALYESFTTDK